MKAIKLIARATCPPMLFCFFFQSTLCFFCDFFFILADPGNLYYICRQDTHRAPGMSTMASTMVTGVSKTKEISARTMCNPSVMLCHPNSILHYGLYCS